MTDKEICAQAIEFAKQNKKRIANELANLIKYASDNIPISVFMAGSPGAGKTEFSKNLIQILEEDKEKSRVVRIDGDEVRQLIPGYIGNNSHLFQGAISLIVEKMHDIVLKQNQSFVFDSTFSNHEKAVCNIKRSLKKKSRVVFIFYIYQKPEIAWKFTQAREESEGRNIPKEAFIAKFLGARITINKIFDEFKNKITIFLVKKNFEDNLDENIYKITQGKKQIDQYIGEEYNEEKLKKYL